MKFNSSRIRIPALKVKSEDITDIFIRVEPRITFVSKRDGGFFIFMRHETLREGAFCTKILHTNLVLRGKQYVIL